MDEQERHMQGDRVGGGAEGGIRAKEGACCIFVAKRETVTTCVGVLSMHSILVPAAVLSWFCFW